VEEVLGESALREAGVFEPGAVARLWAKCQAQAHAAQLSNTDNMALVGVLSTQLLHRHLLRAAPSSVPITPQTLVERPGA
jgi:asparagine synthase (glutamine-hydrolysing)